MSNYPLQLIYIYIFFNHEHAFLKLLCVQFENFRFRRDFQRDTVTLQLAFNCYCGFITLYFKFLLIRGYKTFSISCTLSQTFCLPLIPFLDFELHETGSGWHSSTHKLFHQSLSCFDIQRLLQCFLLILSCRAGNKNGQIFLQRDIIHPLGAAVLRFFRYGWV